MSGMVSPAASTWRVDIEGLRAIAILAVVADHAGLPHAAGGFIGVDVFFVLSGYLITSLLLRELRDSGKIDFAAFYARRLQRLLPGLALMLAVTALATAVMLAPHEQATQARAAMLSLVWLSNFYFGSNNLGYFDPGSESNLYLHTWSLSVEEQFYLVWPLLLVALAARPIESGAAATRLRIGLAWVLLAGLAISVLLTAASPLWAYYLMPSRAWQFALGALVHIYVEASRNSAGEQPAARLPLGVSLLWCGWLGAGMIVASVFLLHERLSYPGLWALAPSVGAALVIGAGAMPLQGHGVGRVLALPGLRFLGKVSYSWYLWHWPVLGLGSLLQPEGGLGYRLALVALSLLLATLAYFLVEQPIRGKAWLRARPAYMMLGSLFVTSAGVLLGVTWQRASAAWAGRPELLVYQQLRADLPPLYAQGCDDWINSAQVRICAYGSETAQRTVVLLGDSVGLQWFLALAPHYQQDGWRVLVVTKSSCPMVDLPVFNARIGAEYVVCEQWRDAAIAYLENLKPDVVFMGSAATYDFSQDQWREGSRPIVARLAAASGKVYVIRGTPRLAFDGPGCLARQTWQPAFLAALSSCESQVQSDPDEAIFEALKLAAADFENVRVLNFNPLLCPNGRCQARRGESVVFRDFQHVANRHAALLAQEVRDVIAAAE